MIRSGTVCVFPSVVTVTVVTVEKGIAMFDFDFDLVEFVENLPAIAVVVIYAVGLAAFLVFIS